MSNPIPEYKLVLIRWRDSSSRSGHKWVEIEELRDREPEFTVYTIGWLVHDDGTYIIVCPHLSPDKYGGDGIGEMKIPKGAVVSQKVLA